MVTTNYRVIVVIVALLILTLTLLGLARLGIAVAGYLLKWVSPFSLCLIIILGVKWAVVRRGDGTGNS